MLRFYSPEKELEAKREQAEHQRISLDLVDAAAPEVLRLAAEILAAELSLDPGLEGKTITMEREHEPVAAILDDLCDELGCSWKLIEGKPLTLEILAGG